METKRCKLFEAKKYVKRYETKLGIHTMSKTAKDIYSFVAHENETTIAQINRHPFFVEDISLSTIKRAVEELSCNDFIKFTRSPRDTRERLITIKG
jgi:DNA-binding MarR family transcriptional regulator